MGQQNVLPVKTFIQITSMFDRDALVIIKYDTEGNLYLG